MNDTNMDRTSDDAIAVVGIAGRFPGCANVDELWSALADCRDCAGLSVPGLADFDIEFFKFGEDEARATDPQQRLFLTESWRAFEDAGVRPGDLRVPVGVFAASSPSQYAKELLRRHMATSGISDPVLYQAPDYLPAQVAYRLGLSGPMFAIQAACAGSLAAVCAASTSLRSYACDFALAGGANLTLPGHAYPSGMESPDGLCRAFDASANGARFASGVGAVVLRRLEDATADGDRIHAVIRGWSIYGDGADRAGFAVPGIEGLSTAIAESLAQADLAPDEVGLIEAHGSGTLLGDALEVRALREVFDVGAPIALGTIKSTLGHLDTACGIAGLIKAVLSVKHGTIPASLHYKTPNPLADFGPFRIPTQTVGWTSTGQYAGVSAIGIGGYNVHVVIGPAPASFRSLATPIPSIRLRERRYWLDDSR